MNILRRQTCKSVQYFLSYSGFKSRPSFSITLYYSSSIRDCLISLYLSFCHFSVIIHVAVHTVSVRNSIVLHPHLSVYIAVTDLSPSPRPPWGSSFGHKLDNSSLLSVCVSSYRLDGPGIESGWRQDFPHPSRPALGLTQPPVQWVRDLFLGG